MYRFGDCTVHTSSLHCLGFVRASFIFTGVGTGRDGTGQVQCEGEKKGEGARGSVSVSETR